MTGRATSTLRPLAIEYNLLTLREEGSFDGRDGPSAIYAAARIGIDAISLIGTGTEAIRGAAGLPHALDS